MRDDMFKVIVERPRLKHGKKSIDSSDGRRFRNRVWCDEDGGQAFHHLGMKAGYGNRKWLNENLAPLQRWFESQVHQHWDKVYSELCTNIDRRNTVQAHIFAHIEQFVIVKTRLINGEIYALTDYRKPEPIGKSYAALFVHPKTRILLPNRHLLKHQQDKAIRKKQQANEATTSRKIINEYAQLHCIDGIWYHFHLSRLPNTLGTAHDDPEYPNKHEKHWDVLRRKIVSLDDCHDHGSNSAYGLYGRADLYATHKRQLSTQEIKQYGLKQKTGNSRPFALYRYVMNALQRSS